MIVLKGKRAASRYISGHAYTGTHKLTIQVLQGLLDMAEHYGICALKGNNGLMPVHEYLERKLISDIQEAEKKRSLEPINF